jgi:hypothetical protein
MNPIQNVMDLAGGPVALTREINKRIERPVTYQAVLKWARQGRLPRTEWTGETRYAKAMSAAVGGRVKVRELLVRPAAVKTEVAAPVEADPAQSAPQALEVDAGGAISSEAKEAAHA